MYALVLYMNEKLISTKPSTSSLRKSFIRPSPATSAPHTAGRCSGDPLEQTSFLSTIKSSIEEIFDILLFDKPDEDGQESPIKPLFHLMSVLRQVPLRHLFAFSRWRATEAESEESKCYLQSWMERDPVAARRCLWHAAMVLSSMRSKKQHACHEPFTLLISVSMIWAFDMLAKPCEAEDWESIETGRDEKGPPTRIDRLKTFEQVERWAKEGRNDCVLLTGIGILRGPESSRRLLIECRKILSSGTAWARLRYAILHGVNEVLQGRPPAHPDDL